MWKMRWWTPLSMGGPCCLIDSQDSIGIWPRLAFSYALSTQDFQSTVICNFWVVPWSWCWIWWIRFYDSTISSWPKSMLVLWWQWFRIGSPAHTTRSNLHHRTWLQMICNIPLFGFISYSWIMFLLLEQAMPLSQSHQLAHNQHFRLWVAKSDKRSKRACAVSSPTLFKFLVKKFLL